MADLIGNYLVLVILEEEYENHAEIALKSSKIIRSHVNGLNSLNLKKGFQGYKTIIGIHTGEILVSNEIRSPSADVVALGENVNVCKKIMEQCHADANEILVSETTVQAVDKKDLFKKKTTIDINLPRLYPNSSHLDIYEEG